MNIYELNRNNEWHWKIGIGVDIVTDASGRPYVRLNRYNSGGNTDERLSIAHPVYIDQSRSLELGRVTGRIDDGRCLVLIRSNRVKVSGSTPIFANNHPDLDSTIFVESSTPVLLGSARERNILYQKLIEDYDTLWMVSPGNTLLVQDQEFTLLDNGFGDTSNQATPDPELWL